MGFRSIVYVAGFLSLLAPISQLAMGQTFKTVVNFDQTNGGWPLAALTQGSDGFLYGTTFAGGNKNAGLIFRLNAGGGEVVYSFCKPAFDCSDGDGPAAPLIEGRDGAFYGTTEYGGAHGCDGYGCGTVFRITTDGTFSVLHRFTSGDGGVPAGALIQATDGNFYGTTQESGLVGDPEEGGTIFRMTPAGRFTVLYKFSNQEND